MEYEEFLGIFASRSSDSNYDKESDELRKKYAELESKLNKELKSKEQELKERNNELWAKKQEVSSLEATIVAYRREPCKKKKIMQDARFVKISKNFPFYAIIGTAVTALTVAGAYFGGYVAAIDAGAVVGALTYATGGTIVDKVLNSTDYIFTKIGGAAGAVGGAICGPIAYRVIPQFESMDKTSDLLARSSIGGVGSLAAVGLCILLLFIAERLDGR